MTKPSPDKTKTLVDDLIEDKNARKGHPKATEKPGITTITERKVEIGPDGKRRVLVRQKTVRVAEGKTDKL